MEYLYLVKIYESLSSTTKHLEKREILSNFLKKISNKDLETVIRLLEGRIFAEGDSRKIGIGTQLVIKSISKSSGKSEDEIIKNWAEIGDLGKVAEKNIISKTQSTLFSKKLTINSVITNLQKLAGIGGSGSVSKKVDLISDLLSSSNGTAAKYIVRTCLEDIRTGAGFGVIRDSIATAFNVEKEILQKAYDLSTDLAHVAVIAKTEGNEGLSKIELNVGRPIKVMLFQKSENMKSAFKTVGTPAVIDYKYDGFRLQIHRNNSEVKLFTRNLEEVTAQFPDIVKIIKRDVSANKYIIDCEIIGYDPKTKAWKPFQAISQRIKRKYDIDELVKKVPVMIIVFDLLLLNNKNLLNEPFKKRRAELKKVVKEDPFGVIIAEEIVTSDPKEGEKFYQKALRRGAEGVMVKNSEGIYKPGSRVGYGLKMKPIMETLDLTIVGAEWGTGKRVNWLSSFILACKNGPDFEEIGKMGTGLKEKEEEGVSFSQITKLLKPFIISEMGRKVKISPKIVIEVAYEEIQDSPTYSSKYALRFPRLVRLRDDLDLEDVDTLFRIEKLKKTQRYRN